MTESNSSFRQEYTTLETDKVNVFLCMEYTEIHVAPFVYIMIEAHTGDASNC